MTWIESFGMLLGRILIASYFMISGVAKMAHCEVSLSLYQEYPYPMMFLYASTLFLILGSFSVFLGYKTRLGGFLLLLAVLPTVDVLVRDFAIIGGLLFVISRGGGLCSFDAMSRSRKEELCKV